MHKFSFKTVRKVLLTEKAYRLAGAENTYLFEVDVSADKKQIKASIEDIYEVKVASVRTLVRRGKIKRQRIAAGKRPNTKKAYVTLPKGQTLPVYEEG